MQGPRAAREPCRTGRAALTNSRHCVSCSSRRGGTHVGRARTDDIEIEASATGRRLWYRHRVRSGETRRTATEHDVRRL